MFQTTSRRHEAEAITSDEKALKHYGTIALLARIQNEATQHLQKSI